MTGGSKPVPPSTPRPSPPPTGPTGPTPTGPGPGRAVPSDADVLRQFDDTLLALAAITHVDPLFRATVPTLAAGDPVTDLRHHLRKALSATRRVAAMHTETPAPSGGPVTNLPLVGEKSAPGPAAHGGSAARPGAGFTLPRRKALPRFDTGEHRLVGQICAEPDAEVLATVASVLRAQSASTEGLPPPMPGSPPSPPPQPDPRPSIGRLYSA
jgi:hypothetical protein